MSIKIYDAAYHKKFFDRAQTELGRRIYQTRWDFVQRHVPEGGRLLDYGCASGAFHKAAPKGFLTEGYDVNPHTGFSKTLDLGFEHFEIVTMWDSIEHLHNPVGKIQELMPEWLFITTPNLESVRGDIHAWKHYRPGEHLYYFDCHSLREILEDTGYSIIEINYEEGFLRDPQDPRAILTLAAKRRI